jgi:hypothetical protein
MRFEFWLLTLIMAKLSVQRQRFWWWLGVLLLGGGGAVWWTARQGTLQPSTQMQTPVAVPAPPVSVIDPRELEPPSLTGPQRVEVTPVEDRYAGLKVLELREEPPPTQIRVRWTVTKLVQDASYKQPMLRVVEQWQQGASGALRVRQSAMVADHVLVRLKPQVRVERVLERFKSLHPELRRRLRASNIWIISFEAPSLDTVPKALEWMRRERSLIEAVEPDYISAPPATPNNSTSPASAPASGGPSQPLGGAGEL